MMEKNRSIELHAVHHGPVNPQNVTVEMDLVNGTKALTVPENSKLGTMLRTYKTLREISIDLEQCAESLDLMGRLVGPAFTDSKDLFVAATALWRSAVIGYGKAMTGGNARKHVKLNPEKIYSGMAAGSMFHHQAIMYERDKYQAHADKTNHESSTLFVMNVSPDGTGEATAVGIQSNRGGVPTRDRVEGFLTVLSFVRAHVKELENKELQQYEIKACQLPDLLKPTTPAN
jgi:hypothetical protein